MHLADGPKVQRMDMRTLKKHVVLLRGDHGHQFPFRLALKVTERLCLDKLHNIMRMKDVDEAVKEMAAWTDLMVPWQNPGSCAPNLMDTAQPSFVPLFSQLLLKNEEDEDMDQEQDSEALVQQQLSMMQQARNVS